MQKTSGCILLKFNLNITEEEKQFIISEFYRRNKINIDGMEYTEFDNIKPVSTIKSFIKVNFENKKKK